MTTAARFRAVLAAFLVSLLLPAFSYATTITIVNTDAAGEGFNDNTPAVPVGGNDGTTVGQQRLKVFQKAAEIWSIAIQSDEEIRVQSSFDALSCTSTSAVLGSAGPQTVESDFPGALRPSTWYVTALANKMAGRDLEPARDDIRARFNSSIGGSNCLNGRNWYYGFDHNEGSFGVDLLAVVLHELGHGLGFLSLVDETTGDYLGNQTDIYSHFLRDQTLGAGWESLTPAQRVASAVNTGKLVWDGPSVKAHVSSILQSGADATGRALLYAPNPVQPGSSVSHFDVSATPNLIMEPAINANLTSDLDLTLFLFEDIGWMAPLSAVDDPGPPAPPTPTGLRGNRPNPFRSNTSIRFDLERSGEAAIDVFDVSGRLVRELVDGPLDAGSHEVTWDARDESGRDVSAGIYFYRLTTGGRSETKRMVLVR